MFMSIIKRVKTVMVALVLVSHGATVSAFVPSGYQQVARLAEVPEQYFYGIALNESGKQLISRDFRPWPWTLNVEGKAYFYPTRKACYLALTDFLKVGKKLIDIGLMQVNWHYHQDKLHDPWQALDPYFNLQVGATILRHEYDLTHDWYQAVGRYHSPGQHTDQKQRANQYAHHVFRRIDKLRLHS
jgi:soluble lytic murein transglycosylase-like protein